MSARSHRAVCREIPRRVRQTPTLPRRHNTSKTCHGSLTRIRPSRAQRDPTLPNAFWADDSFIADTLCAPDTEHMRVTQKLPPRSRRYSDRHLLSARRCATPRNLGLWKRENRSRRIVRDGQSLLAIPRRIATSASTATSSDLLNSSTSKSNASQKLATQPCGAPWVWLTDRPSIRASATRTRACRRPPRRLATGEYRTSRRHETGWWKRR